jgi:hypothetical protein
MYQRLLVFFVALDSKFAGRAHRELVGATYRDTQGRPVEVHVGFLDDRGEFLELSGMAEQCRTGA